ncbi:TetR/AcrR family transcriptional regulator [Nonomuraea sp. NPDC050556]|uniref:TetR/AcrR family transcriptional regulator n=1 Tax=Nonomuraea sp. NPDC050556 TaxID=3364369 RepID=UPI00379201C2
MPAKRRRVPAMAPEERRAALIAATIPLLREHGMSISTRQIAEAAGVAEGTIFGVFRDKNSLLRAAVLTAYDAQPLCTALASIDSGADLRTRLRETVALLRKGLVANANLVAAPRTLMADDDAEFVERMMEGRQRAMAAVAAVIEPDAAQLRRAPEAAAHLLMMQIMMSVHRGFAPLVEPEDLDDDEIVSILLDGLLVRTAPTAREGAH